MDLGPLADNAIVYVLIAWACAVAAARALGLQRRGFDVKPYGITYRNAGVQRVLDRVLGRTRLGARALADASVVSGFAMMGFALWFMASNVASYFAEPAAFAEVTVLIPGVTLTSAPAILNFLLCIPIVLVMHEGAHGIVAALERIRIRTGGFAVFVAVFAGFVEPDEEEFGRARRLSKLRVIGAGATANVAFSLALGALLLTNPAFAAVVPEPLRSAFYEEPGGVAVLSVIGGSGAEAAGLLPGDLIVGVGGLPVRGAHDLQAAGLEPGAEVRVDVLRGGSEASYVVEVMASPDEPGRGLIGITRDAGSSRPVLDFVRWDSPELTMFLMWLWMLSFFIGVINMLPLPILDGGKFVQILAEGRMSEAALGRLMWGVYSVTFALFGLNIALSYAKSGWFTI